MREAHAFCAIFTQRVVKLHNAPSPISLTFAEFLPFICRVFSYFRLFGFFMRITLKLLLFFTLSTRFVSPAAWQPGDGPLKTRWAKDVSPQNALPDYPRPQFVRSEWLNLNGLWDLAITAKGAKPDSYTNQILVPYPIESALSGMMRPVSENDRLWYRRNFDIPRKWLGRRVLLHFGAVDFEATVWVNGKRLGQHRGGYDGFSFDITDALNPSGDNELAVSVWDPTDAGTQPRGKQVRKPNSIWYTSTSGIWQTVWLEPVSAAHLTGLKIVPDLDHGAVKIQPDTPTPLIGKFSIELAVRDGASTVASASTEPGKEVQLSVTDPQVWSPESPHLYSVVAVLKLGDRAVDRVESYFGMRKISLGKDDKGFTRLMLNNQPYFQFGPLDQGFWPDGIYTAPTDEALRFDIEMTKKLGFNLARKHVKVEPERWYYWCDKLGLLVWQDMPSGDKYIGRHDGDITRTPESGSEFEQELKALVQGRANHPCIVMWVPFNEGWGQWDTPRIVDLLKQLDPSRLVDDASGWVDRGVGDVMDLHRYPGPGAPEPETNRAIVLGEFGGLGLPLPGHTWQAQKNWGYRSFTNSVELTSAYLGLTEKLFPLIAEKGLSAAVYTQTTDVEIEVNGLMTYDRELVKMDWQKIAAANRGRLATPVKEPAPAGK
jgi:beta-galactosidase/beta-glucuronidase